MTDYKIVPVEPTQEMIDAGRTARTHPDERYKAMLAAAPAVQGEPIGWYTEDHFDDKSATTYSAEVAQRWRDKGWPVWPLYAAPQPAEQQPAPDVSAQDGGVTMFEHLTITENWNGEGLPPIGERVGNNQLNTSGFYAPAIIVAHVPYRDQLAAVFVLEDKSDWSWSCFGLDDLGQRAFVPWASVSQSA